mmetsp:Transcript_29474/g.69326  ORF Transcript_29474/g.69326 Transcript_29474/m.69326 type:complete len:299 (+) Transcript_29474:409-1305(+)
MQTYRSRIEAGSKATTSRTRDSKDSRSFGGESRGWGVMNLGVVRRALTSPSPSSPSERATADETGDADHVDVDVGVVDGVCTYAVGRLKRLMDSRLGGRVVVGLLLFSVVEGLLLWNTWSATGVVSEQLGTRIKANANSNTNSNNNSNSNNDWPEHCSANCYMNNNEDLRVKFAGKPVQHALKHYLKLGQTKGRSCICRYMWPEDCSWMCYRKKNPDLVKFTTEEQAFAHWTKRGEANGRDCSCTEGWPKKCSARCYVFNNPDLKHLTTDVEVLQHWTRHAKKESRDCVCHDKQHNAS